MNEAYVGKGWAIYKPHGLLVENIQKRQNKQFLTVGGTFFTKKVFL